MHYHGGCIHATPAEFQTAVVRALTEVPPVCEEESLIHEFIARWPEYTGSWLLMHCGLLRCQSKDSEYSNASLIIQIDRHSSWMSVAVKGLKQTPLPGFNDWYIRRQQFISFHFLKNGADADSR
ncbi:hypothetical protein QMZ62_23230 [Serratia sp. PF2-63]|uniref:hypothetical protein n=1 Tax=Enterobacterales TaxID=91347 RepID=UPI0024B59CD0|nr:MULTISPECIES: hypothetical protein [Enterobacterales]MDI9223664.1 hypothetical protein [Pantoea sp. EA-12]MDI9265864.1 hypothetical protein [Serratia sp. PF2-63]MDI9267168.1 hypothetical protein [Serratia sp. PF-27]